MKYRASCSPRFRICPVFLGLLMFAIAGCGGGGAGGGLSSSATTVQVSLASAPEFPAGTSFASTQTAAEEAAVPGSAVFDNVFVEIRKVALLPSRTGEGPDPNGEVVAEGSADDGGFVSAVVDPPVVVDLLHLPPGRKIARFLNRLENIPAGSYGKIRVYYGALWGVRSGDTVDFHPTAHSHFDVHFVGGNLEIPVGTDVEGGIRLAEATIRFVGLKIVENPSRVHIRPQVFATVEPVQYLVSGFVDNVDKSGDPGAFDLSRDGDRSFHVLFSYDNDVTNWAFLDNDTKRKVAIDNNDLGIAALQDGAFVDVYGKFPGGDTLSADRVVISFPVAISGVVAEGGDPPSVWQNGAGHEFFELNPSSSPTDNAVILRPDRTWAYYDNTTSGGPLTDAAIDNNVSVTARGYSDPVAGTWAFWISVDP